MRTPTKNTPIGTSILTPSCNITPTRETARDGAYDEFASLTQNDCSEAPRDGPAPSEAPAVSVEPAYDGAEPSPSSPFTYDGAGDRAEPAGGYDSFDPFPGIPAPTKPEEVHEAAAAEPETADDDAPATRALSTLVGDDLDPYAGAEEEDLDGVDSILDAILGEEEEGRTPSPPPLSRRPLARRRPGVRPTPACRRPRSAENAARTPRPAPAPPRLRGARPARASALSTLSRRWRGLIG